MITVKLSRNDYNNSSTNNSNNAVVRVQKCSLVTVPQSAPPLAACVSLPITSKTCHQFFTVLVFQGIFWYLGHKTLSICYCGSLGRSFWDGEWEQRPGHAGIKVAVSARFHREVRLKSQAGGKTPGSFVIFPVTCAQGCCW